MEHAEGALLYEMQRIDLEFAVVNSIAKDLRKREKINSAEDVEEAAKYLQKAAILLNSARKWSGVSEYEQIKMDFTD